MRTNSSSRARSIAAIVSLLVLAGLLAAVLVMPASGAVGDELLPDLKAQPVGEADATATFTDETGTHLLLRFSSYIANVGAGPLEVTGVNPSNRSISGDDLRQVITHADATKTEAALPNAQLMFEETDGHDHWHFQKAARYSLYNGTAAAPGTQEVGFSNKVGFCFLDIGHGDPNYNPNVDSPDHFLYAGTVAPRAFYHDATTHPAQPCLTGQDGTPEHPFALTDKVDMGISAGWRDIYEKTLPFQYVDVSDATPGYYWIKSEVDPDDLLTESDDNNAAAFSTKASIVPGYIARAVNAGQISGVKESTSKITLASTSYGATGLRYKIVDQPEHGTLKPATGTADGAGWFAATQVIYTKDGAYNGPDTFKFAAKQAGSQFPLNPTSASVTMQVGSGDGDTTVGINGAPAWVYTSAGVQLGATVVPSGDVTWRVNDVIGGHPGVGTIDAAGFYRAPATVPTDDKVRITATSDDGAFDAVEITIVKRPVVTPKPDVPDPPAPPSNPTTPTTPAKPALATLSKAVIGRVGRRLIVKYMPGKTGKLYVKIGYKGKRIGTCSMGVVKARSATCRFKLKKSKVKKLKGKLTVSAALKVKGKTVATRRTTVSLAAKASSATIGPLCILTPIEK